MTKVARMILSAAGALIFNLFDFDLSAGLNGKKHSYDGRQNPL
jgi:hypothetical protein